MFNDSETFFIRFLMIDTTSDQDLGSIAQKLCPSTERVQFELVSLMGHGMAQEAHFFYLPSALTPALDFENALAQASEVSGPVD